MNRRTSTSFFAALSLSFFENLAAQEQLQLGKASLGEIISAMTLDEKISLLVGGSGSGDVNRAYTVSLTEGLANAGLQLDKSDLAQYNETSDTWQIPTGTFRFSVNASATDCRLEGKIQIHPSNR